MLQIRHGVFETNSSSTHSITMCSQDELNAWKDGKIYLNDIWWKSNIDNPAKDKTFLTKEEAISLAVDYGCLDDYESLEDCDDIEKLEPEELLNLFNEYQIYSFDNYSDEEYLEYFEESYTTPGGETVIAFGKYGYDY